jgi:DNA-binding TFAR19-related protein (PDSD5 family)
MNEKPRHLMRRQTMELKKWTKKSTNQNHRANKTTNQKKIKPAKPSQLNQVLTRSAQQKPKTIFMLLK